MGLLKDKDKQYLKDEFKKNLKNEVKLERYRNLLGC